MKKSTIGAVGRKTLGVIAELMLTVMSPKYKRSRKKL